jgi:rifamycin polyketide synthase module 1/2/3
MLKTDLIAPVCALLKRQASERPTRMAFRDAHSSLDYAALERSTALLAAQLQAAGLAEGESVALMLPNSVAWVQGCLATLRAGGVFVPVSNDSAPPEVAYRLADADATLLVISIEKAQQLAAVIEAAPRLRTLVLVGGAQSTDALSGVPARSAAGALQRLSFEALLQAGNALATLPPARDPQDTQGVSFIVYTSGTTGQPKGVQLSQHGMMWAVAACWEPVFQLSAADHLLSPLPLFHSYALNLCVLTPIALGMGVTILERYSTQEVRERLRTGEYTLMPGVPTMFNYLLEAEKGQPPSRLPGMRLFYTAGAIMPAPLSQAFERQFGVRPAVFHTQRPPPAHDRHPARAQVTRKHIPERAPVERRLPAQEDLLHEPPVEQPAHLRRRRAKFRPDRLVRPGKPRRADLRSHPRDRVRHLEPVDHRPTEIRLEPPHELV